MRFNLMDVLPAASRNVRIVEPRHLVSDILVFLAKGTRHPLSILPLIVHMWIATHAVYKKPQRPRLGNRLDDERKSKANLLTTC